ncbi:hypothetical protein GGI43DRAFT_391214, partial [Trichoderma evansii]
MGWRTCPLILQLLLTIIGPDKNKRDNTTESSATQATQAPPFLFAFSSFLFHCPTRHRQEPAKVPSSCDENKSDVKHTYIHACSRARFQTQVYRPTGTPLKSPEL